MTIDVRIRVVAEIYRGIDFPDDWVAHSTDITAAMGKELVVSVIALLDAERTARRRLLADGRSRRAVCAVTFRR